MNKYLSDLILFTSISVFSLSALGFIFDLTIPNDDNTQCNKTPWLEVKKWQMGVKFCLANLILRLFSKHFLSLIPDRLY